MNGYDSVTSGGSGGSNYVGNTAIQKQGIASTHAELQSVIEGVNKRISELETRLTAILSPLGPPQASGNSGSTPAPPRSGMLDAMLTAKQDVAMLGVRIDQIMNRIEL